MNIAIVLTEQGIIPSRSEARKMIEEGAIAVDGKITKDVFFEFTPGRHSVEVNKIRTAYVTVPENKVA